MIKTEELRKGNLIKDIQSGRIGYVLTIGEKKCTLKMPFSKLSQSYEEFESIDLNEDWLFKFGFEKDDQVDEIDGLLFVLFYLGDYIVEHWIRDKTFKFTDDCNLKITVSSVHHLQNLIFALTGSELTIKEGK